MNKCLIIEKKIYKERRGIDIIQEVKNEIKFLVKANKEEAETITSIASLKMWNKYELAINELDDVYELLLKINDFNDSTLEKVELTFNKIKKTVRAALLEIDIIFNITIKQLKEQEFILEKQIKRLVNSHELNPQLLQILQNSITVIVNPNSLKKLLTAYIILIKEVASKTTKKLTSINETILNLDKKIFTSERSTKIQQIIK